MDEAYLLACARSVELNPVRARLTKDAADRRWSSAAAHLAGRDDGLVTVRPLFELVPVWRGFLAGGLGEVEHASIRAGERSGRPLGSAAFVTRLEQHLNRSLARQKPGPKPKATSPVLCPRNSRAAELGNEDARRTLNSDWGEVSRAILNVAS